MKPLANELAIAKAKEQLTLAESKNRQLIKLVSRLEKERDASIRFGVKTIPIIKSPSKGKSEGTAVVLCSDWHIEERVKSASVSGLNEYTLDIAKARCDKFWRTTARMVHIFKRDIPIPRLVLWLGGD